MAGESAQRLAWALARRQHWAVTRQQLLGLGFPTNAIDERIAGGRLHPIHRGVYAVGRPDLTREGYFMAAVLACREGAALSHESAGELWQITLPSRGPLHVSVPERRQPRRPGIAVHRRRGIEVRVHRAIPVTSPIDTIVDIAPGLTEPRLERAINEAANRDLVDPERLRAHLPARHGTRLVARLLDRDTYVVTDTRLEQRLLTIALQAGLPRPQTQRRLSGGRVDFYWPELMLIVEADSLRFHRTAAQQRADRLRDQKHAAAGFTTLRFTHWQIFHDPDHVVSTLASVAGRLGVAA
jgi:very-short-patch-repair endonuclease